ncbi:hypothetical protein MMC21_008308 [Puttea exsequens]|nr:hypothetical protein [Puttea exsequens]
MATKPIPRHINTVIIGNGPSALILSYILHGHVPYYNPSTPHPDPILHKKLSQSPCLLDIDWQDLTTHFAASRLSYSTQTLPINVLLDTLLRPLADTEPGRHKSCVEWRFEKDRSIEHIVLGNTPQAGGQWADNPVSASWDIGALSYAEMLSLPGYSFSTHHTLQHNTPMPEFHRPTRREVAAYLATYPSAVGIRDSIYTSISASDIHRLTTTTFHIPSQALTCHHLILATGTFSQLVPPRPLLQPLQSLPPPTPSSPLPLLVIGSGFSAADIIISTPSARKIIHIYKWDPDVHPSPLRACHPSAYPEYSGVYRRMKQAAQSILGTATVRSPLRRGKSDPFARDCGGEYEGLPNTVVKEVEMRGGSAILTLETGDKKTVQREISSMEYVIGRRGSLDYLDNSLAAELGLDLAPRKEDAATIPISNRAFRHQLEQSLQLAPGVFVTGSLTGDSLVRFSFGGCVYAAREILRATKRGFELRSVQSRIGISGSATEKSFPTTAASSSSSSSSSSPSSIPISTPISPASSPTSSATSSSPTHTHGHSDLSLDRRKLSVRALSIEHEVARCDMWRDHICRVGL